MGIEGTKLVFEILAKMHGSGLRDLARDARKAKDDLDDLDKTNKRIGEDDEKSLRALRDRRQALRELASEARKASSALGRLNEGGGSSRGGGSGGGLRTIKPRLGDGKDEERKGHNIGTRIGAAMARGIAAALIDGFGMIGRSLLSMPPHMQAILVGAVASMAIPLGAALNGVILAALGAGAVAAGLAVAVRDPRVKEAGGLLGKELAAGLKEQSAAFVPATLHAIEAIRSAFRAAGPDLHAFFDAGSTLMVPLTKGLTEFATRILPGVTAALERNGPVVGALADGLAETGAALGSMFDVLSSQSGGAAAGLRSLFAVMDVGLGSIVGMVTGLTFLYDKISFLRPAWLMMVEDANKHGSALLTTGAIIQVYNRYLAEKAAAEQKTATTSAFAKMSLQEYTAAIRDSEDANLSAIDAQYKLAQALVDAKVKHGDLGKGIDEHTAAGRRNWAVLKALATTSVEATRKVHDLSGSQGEAAEMARAAAAKFVKLATDMGLSKAEAYRLAVQLGLIPKNVNPKVWLTDHATGPVNNIKAAIAAIKNKNVTVAVYYRYRNLGPGLGSGLHVPGGTITEKAHGGPVRRNTPYLVGERGPELVVPRRDGNVIPAGRTRQLMAGSGGGGNDMAGAIRAALTGIAVVLDGRVVGSMQARTADIFTRGG